MKFCFLIIALLTTLTASDRLDEFLLLMQKKVNELAQNVLMEFSKFDGKCNTLSYDECEGTSQLQCFKHFPTLEQCLGQGVKLAKISAIKIPPLSLKQKLTDQQKHLVCKTAQLNTYFQKIHEDSEGRFFTSYIGTSTGAFRSYPTFKIDFKQQDKYNCQNYDPRFRAWYASAITGSKNVVFMMDTSNSLRDHLQAMKISANYLIDTFSKADLVLLMYIGDKIEYFNGQAKFVKMQDKTKQKAQESLNNINKTSGNANLTKSIQASFQILQKSRLSSSLCCQNKDTKLNNVVFVLFTDVSQNTQNENQTNTQNYKINQIFQKYKDRFKTQLFVYSFQKPHSQNATSWENLACKYNGQYFKILINQAIPKLKSIIQKIYRRMAKGQKFTKAVWSAFYQDAFGYGLLSSIVKPVYYHQSEYLIGVAGIDVPKSQWLKLESNISQAERRISTFNSYMIIDLQSDCQQTEILPPFKKIQGSVFRTPEVTSTRQCCGVTTEAFIGIMSGIGALIISILLGIGVFCLCKKRIKLKEQKLQKQKQQQQLNSQRNLIYSNKTLSDDMKIFPYPPPEIFD